jgi:hypothetical protein
MRRHRLDILLESGRGCVASSEGDEQEQAKPFELGMRVVVRLGEVYRLVVHNLVNLSKVA